LLLMSELANGSVIATRALRHVIDKMKLPQAAGPVLYMWTVVVERAEPLRA